MPLALRRNALLLLLAAVAACSDRVAPMKSPDWRPLGATADGQRFFVDAASIGDAGGLRSVWLRVGEEEGGQREALAFDCAQRLVARARGEVDRRQLRPVDPGTIMPTVFNAACSGVWTNYSGPPGPPPAPLDATMTGVDALVVTNTATQ